MTQDYIPRNDGDLIVFATNFRNQTASNAANFGLNVTDSEQVERLLTNFQNAHNNHNNAQLTARAARQAKDDSRDELVKELRSQAQRVQKSVNVTNEKRAELGLTVSDAVKTATEVPTTRPVGQIDTSQPLRHTIKFYDNVSESKAKPAGVMGCEVWVKIGGEATMNEDDYRFLALDTATPYLAIHKAEDIGKKAHYLLRWVNTKGEKGAWGDVVSGVITG